MFPLAEALSEVCEGWRRRGQGAPCRGRSGGRSLKGALRCQSGQGDDCSGHSAPSFHPDMASACAELFRAHNDFLMVRPVDMRLARLGNAEAATGSWQRRDPSCLAGQADAPGSREAGLGTCAGPAPEAVPWQGASVLLGMIGILSLPLTAPPGGRQRSVTRG